MVVVDTVCHENWIFCFFKRSLWPFYVKFLFFNKYTTLYVISCSWLHAFLLGSIKQTFWLSTLVRYGTARCDNGAGLTGVRDPIHLNTHVATSVCQLCQWVHFSSVAHLWWNWFPVAGGSHSSTVFITHLDFLYSGLLFALTFSLLMYIFLYFCILQMFFVHYHYCIDVRIYFKFVISVFGGAALCFF